jgi:hypothetical protein
LARIDAPHHDSPPPVGSLNAALASAVIATLCAALCFVNSGPLRWLAGVALMLLLPGDAVRRLVRVPGASLPGTVIMLSVSLVLTIIVGVVVDQTSPGITARSMAVGLLIVTVLANVTVVLASRAASPHEPAQSREEAQSGSEIHSGSKSEAGVSWRVALLSLALFALPAGVAVAVAVHSAQRQDRNQAVAALSIQQQGQDAVVEVDQDPATDATYILQVSTGSRSLMRMKFDLRAGARRDIVVSRPVVRLGQRLTATLSRPGETQPFRSVWLVNTGQ